MRVVRAIAVRQSKHQQPDRAVAGFQYMKRKRSSLHVLQNVYNSMRAAGESRRDSMEKFSTAAVDKIVEKHVRAAPDPCSAGIGRLCPQKRHPAPVLGPFAGMVDFPLAQVAEQMPAQASRIS